MKASELVVILQKLIEEHGDLECVDTFDDSIELPEVVEGTIVLADKA